jgi:hypothetical protein
MSGISASAASRAEPMMWCAMLKAALAGPAPWVAAKEKTIRAPTLAIHLPARVLPKASAPKWDSVSDTGPMNSCSHPCGPSAGDIEP